MPIFGGGENVLPVCHMMNLVRGVIENKHSTDVVFRRTESARLYEVLHSP